MCSTQKSASVEFVDLLSFEEITDYKTIDDLVELQSTEKINKKKRKKQLKKETSKSDGEEKLIPLKRCKKIKKSMILTSEISDNLSGPTKEITDFRASMTEWIPYNIHVDVLHSLADKCFNSPTDIQAMCLPEAMLKRKDVFGAAETGSGKTLAFGIPIVSSILESTTSNIIDNDINTEMKTCDDKKLWALIVEPTRELVIQVKNHLQDICKYTNIEVLEIVGGLSIEKQNRKLNKHPHIVVGTPGRLWQLIQNGNDFLSSGIDNLRFLVIDEADRMVEKLHFPELLALLERINYHDNQDRQTFVFSATLTLVHEPPKYLAKKRRKNKPTRVTPGNKLQSFIELVGAKHPIVIDITKENVITSGLKEYCIQCTVEEKDIYLLYLLKVHTGRKIVFANGVNSIRRLVDLCKILEIKAFPLFADMIQKQRLKNLERFQSDQNGILLATDVAARGLDIDNVEFIIHYHVPKTSEIYVHRSGRSARGKNEGTTVLLCSPMEMVHYKKIKQTLGKGELPAYSVKLAHIYNAVKNQMTLARNILQLKINVQRITNNANWIERCANEMEILLDDDEKPKKLNNQEQKQCTLQLKSMERKLKLLLSKPILPFGISPRYPSYDINLMNDRNNSNKKIK